MKLTFTWTTGTASDRMREALKAAGREMYHNRYFSPCTMVNGRECVLDYTHLGGCTFEIVEKVYRFRQAPELRPLEF